MITAIKAWVMQYAMVGALVLAGLGWAAAGVQTVRLAWLESATAKATTKASEAARGREQLANTENRKVIDELLRDKALADAARDASAQRLRNLSAGRSAAAAACAGNHETAAANLPDRTREDLESQADRANEVALQLAAAQAYITRVCQPAQ